MLQSATGWPGPLGATLLVCALVGVMYLGRKPAHAAIHALAGALHGAFGTLASFALAAHARVGERNRGVLLEMGRESAERSLEREFQRVGRVVARDLAGYPELHRKLIDRITRIDEDYREATEVPPELPDWTRAIESIARFSPQGDPLVGRILNEIKKTLVSSHREAIAAYRRGAATRHRTLRRMLPSWRRLEQTLERVNGSISGLSQRADAIDGHMASYAEIRASSEEAERALSASSTTHLISSALVLGIALLGGVINFHLIALPMSEMVGATSRIGPILTSDVAALVIIATEVAMGLFLVEALRITRLFPVIGRMDDVLRIRMAWLAFGLLAVLAGVEASLAYMRDLLAADREALALSLAGAQAVDVRLRWIPSVGQMVMGFVLPFALAFAAIPLESFIQSARIAGGRALALALRASAALMQLGGQIAEGMAPLLVHLYDLLIVLPLRLEQLLSRERMRPLEKQQRLHLPRSMT